MEKLKKYHINILYSAKNFVVIEYERKYYCYSYKKIVAVAYKTIMDIYKYKIIDDNVESAQNKCHIKQFKDVLEGRLK